MGQSILLVEDNPADYELTRLIMQQTGICEPLVCVGCIRDALQSIKQEAPSMVLLDLGLPDASELDGLDNIVRLLPQVPVVVLSGQSDQQLAMRAIQRGAQDYLTKGDFSPDILERVHRYAIERKRAEGELCKMARYDAVTGLTNRSYFISLLEHSLDRAKRRDSKVSVLFLDLDNFKHINDTFGHKAGDELLQQVSNRLVECARACDIVARLGGDEFTILLEDIDAIGVAETVANKILHTIMKPYQIGNVDLIVTTSIGIACYPSAGDNAESLLKHADVAMYRAKEGGRNNVEFYTDEMNAEMLHTFELESALRSALDNGEFELHYQALVNQSTGSVAGMEALIRWNRPGYSKKIMPDEFIPALERTGLIHPVGDWVLMEACRACQKLYTEYGIELRVAVNVSPSNLVKSGFLESVKHALNKTGLRSCQLELEITEHVLMEESEANKLLLQQLQQLGVSISIDDFGTGYSSLGYLTKFPFDVLKIDRSLIDQVPAREDSTMIMIGILAIAGGLGRKVVAEGVESEQQFKFLSEKGCDECQGRLFSKPLPFTEFVNYFLQNNQSVCRSIK